MDNGYLTTPEPVGLGDAIVQSLMEINQNVWDMDFLTDLFNDRDMTLICQIPIPMYSREDD